MKLFTLRMPVKLTDTYACKILRNGEHARMIHIPAHNMKNADRGPEKIGRIERMPIWVVRGRSASKCDAGRLGIGLRLEALAADVSPGRKARERAKTAAYVTSHVERGMVFGHETSSIEEESYISCTRDASDIESSRIVIRTNIHPVHKGHHITR